MLVSTLICGLGIEDANVSAALFAKRPAAEPAIFAPSLSAYIHRRPCQKSCISSMTKSTCAKREGWIVSDVPAKRTEHGATNKKRNLWTALPL